MPRSKRRGRVPSILRREAGRRRLHRLLEHQHYRLAWWRSAGDATNWRRFFDINGLVGLRIEDETVFEATHATLLRLYQQGLIDGVRVDHVDGLADPRGLLPPPAGATRCIGGAAAGGCAARSGMARGREDPRRRRAPARRLGGGWHQRLRLHGRGERAAARRLGRGCVARVLGRGEWSPHRLCRRGDRGTTRCARAHLHVAARCGGRVAASIATARVDTRDTTRAAIRRALVALLAHFPVYRSYGVGQPSDAVAHAVAGCDEGGACRLSSDARAA